MDLKKKIKIYLKNSSHSIARTHRIGMYLMEWINPEGKIYNYPGEREINVNRGKVPSVRHIEGTWLEADAGLLLEAMHHVTRPCEVEVVTECAQTSIMLEMWLPRWREGGWKKSNGKEVGETYRQLDAVISGKGCKVYAAQSENGYAAWMEEQMKGETK